MKLKKMVEELGLFPSMELEQKIKSQFREYIMYEPAGKGKRHWKCTACNSGEIGYLQGTRNEYIRCPRCDAIVQLKASNCQRTGTTMEKREKILYFRERGKELYAVACYAYLVPTRNSWDGPDWYTDIEYLIKAIYHWPGPGMEPEMFHADFEGHAIWSNKMREPFLNFMNPYDDTFYYVENLEDISKTTMRYAALDLWAEAVEENETRMDNAVKYLTSYAKEPALELALKWEMTDVAMDLVLRKKANKRLVNWQAKTPWSFVRMSKQQYRIFEEIPCFMNDRKVTSILTDWRKWGMQLDSYLMAVRNAKTEYAAYADIALEIRKKHGLTLKQIINYADKQNRQVDIRYWRDYLNMAAAVGRDLSDYNATFPKNLMRAHDAMVDLRRTMQDEERANSLMEQYSTFSKRRYPKLVKKYEYKTKNGLAFVVPTGANDLIREGNTLKICVGGYATRYLEGKTDIVFLRKARRPERSYICIEIRDGKIIQVHGYRNENLGAGKHPVAPEVRYEKEIAEWLAWIRAGSHKQTVKESKTA